VRRAVSTDRSHGAADDCTGDVSEISDGAVAMAGSASAGCRRLPTLTTVPKALEARCGIDRRRRPESYDAVGGRGRTGNLTWYLGGLSQRGLKRFTGAQAAAFDRALTEIKSGKKSTCWMWFVVPTPPYMVDGVERGSCLNRKFAVRSEEEARAFLKFEDGGVRLRDNYLEMLRAIRDQLRAGRSAIGLLGGKDAPKLASSVAFFAKIADGGVDDEVYALACEVLEAM